MSKYLILLLLLTRGLLCLAQTNTNSSEIIDSVRSLNNIPKDRYEKYYIEQKTIKHLPFREINKLCQVFPSMYYAQMNTLWSHGVMSGGNNIILDGMQISDATTFPLKSISRLALMNNEIPLQYGNFTGSLVVIETPDIVDSLTVNYEFTTGMPFYTYSDNIFGFDLHEKPFYTYKNFIEEINVSFPVKIKKESTRHPSVLFAMNTTRMSDPSPSAINSTVCRTDIISDIVNNPLRPSGLGYGSFPNAAYLNESDFTTVRFKQNAEENTRNYYTKISIPVNRNISLALGNYSKIQDGKYYVYDNAMFNWYNNPDLKYTYINSYFRYKHKIIDNEDISLNLQAGLSYSYYNSLIEDPEFKDNFFYYGYVGKFKTHKVRSYTETPQLDTLLWLTGYLQNGFRDTLYDFYDYWANGQQCNFTDQINPAAKLWNQSYYELYDNIFGNYSNNIELQNGGGLLNGESPDRIYGLWNNYGTKYDLYSKSRRENIRADALLEFSHKSHYFLLGFEYNKLTERAFSISPRNLWTLARNITNNHILELDLTNPHPIFDNNFVFQDTIYYDRLYNEDLQSVFDKNLRISMGLPVDGTDWIEVDMIDPSDLSIDMFSADELLNNGYSYVNYYGYGYTGEINKDHVTCQDFFNTVDAYGNKTRPVKAFTPVYYSVFGKYRFLYKFIRISVGMRLDYYNANQPVLKDKYSLYEIRTAGDVSQISGNPVSHPGNIRDNYAVYVNDILNPTAIIGYRDEDTWYDADGNEIDDPTLLYTATGIAPYLVDTDAEFGHEAFEYYTPVISLLPDLGVEYNIFDGLNVFANYSSQSLNPEYYNIYNPAQYLFINQLNGEPITNTDLKPELVSRFYMGFRQNLFERMNFELSVSNTTIYNCISTVYIAGAYPVNYFTYDNNLKISNTGINFSFIYSSPGISGINAGLNYFRLIDKKSDYLGQPENILNSYCQFNFGGKNDYIGFDTGISRKLLQYLGMSLFFHYRTGLYNTYPFNITPTGLSDTEYLIFLDHNITNQTVNFYYFDIKLEKGFPLLNEKFNLYFYLLIQNLFNRQNVFTVYSATGSPDDDGYLTAPEYQAGIASQYNEDSFRYMYSAKVRNPFHYDIPRIVRIGAGINF